MSHPPAGKPASAPPQANNLRGALWMVLAAVLFTVMMSLIKHLGGQFHSVQIVLFRAMVSVAILVPIM